MSILVLSGFLFCVGVLTGAVGNGGGLLFQIFGTPLFGVGASTVFATDTMLIAQSCSALRTWRSIRWKIVLWYAPISASAGFAGAECMHRIPEPLLQRALGVSCIVFVILRLRGWRPAVPKSTTLLVLLIATNGFLGGIIKGGGVYGRSSVLLSYNLDARTFVATSSAIAIAQNLAQMCGYLMHAERLQTSDLILVCICTPLGVFVGQALHSAFSKKWFERTQMAIVAAGGAFLLISSL